jgi:hypothetical protein
MADRQAHGQGRRSRRYRCRAAERANPVYMTIIFLSGTAKRYKPDRQELPMAFS